MPDTRPVVSILLLCRNEDVFLQRALRSVLAQTITGPVEIILPQDVLRDDSAAIARAEVAAAAPRFSLRVIQPEADSGADPGSAKAFVAALEAARGQFYHVLDGDDFWIDPDKLRRQVAVLQAHPTLAAVGHRTILRASEDGNESFHPQQDPLKAVLHLEDLLTAGCDFHSSAMLFRNSFFDAGAEKTAAPAIFHDVCGDRIRLFVHAAIGGICYLPQTMSIHDEQGGGAGADLDWPARRKVANSLYIGLAEHGYLTDMGQAGTAEYLATRLARIAAYSPASLRPISLYPDQVAGASRHRLTEVSHVSTVLDLETQLSALTASGQYEEALRLAFRFLTAIGYDRNIARAGRSRRLSCPEIDWHCAHIGGLIATRQNILPVAADPQETKAGPVVLVVSGMVEDQDGLWDALCEMIALWRGRARIVILSTEMVPTMGDIQARVGPDVTLLLNTDQGLVEKTAWLTWHLAQQDPSRILVIPTRNDVAILAGLRREHAPCIHLVATYDTGYLPCCHSYALDGYVARRPYDLAWFRKIAPWRELINLPRLIPAATAPDPLGDNLPLVTATAALTDDPMTGQYDYGLHKIVPLMLNAGVQRHIHIGALPETMAHRIRKELVRQDMPPEAFVHLPLGDDMGGQLRAAGATLFLQGFPFPETRPLLAAMAAGLPVLAHRNYLHPALSLIDLCPPGTPEWANGDQLATFLRNIGPGWTAERSAQTWAHVAVRRSAETLLATIGAGFMVPVDAVEIPDMAVPDDRQALRRLMSDLLEVTVFRP